MTDKPRTPRPRTPMRKVLVTAIRHVAAESAVVLHVQGDLDATAVVPLTEGAAAATEVAARHDAGVVVLDLSGIALCGAAAVHALVRADQHVRQHGLDLVVVVPEDGIVDTVLILTGAIALLTVRISLDHAFMAARKDRTAHHARRR